MTVPKLDFLTFWDRTKGAGAQSSTGRCIPKYRRARPDRDGKTGSGDARTSGAARVPGDRRAGLWGRRSYPCPDISVLCDCPVLWFAPGPSTTNVKVVESILSQYIYFEEKLNNSCIFSHASNIPRKFRAPVAAGHTRGATYILRRRNHRTEGFRHRRGTLTPLCLSPLPPSGALSGEAEGGRGSNCAPARSTGQESPGGNPEGSAFRTAGRSAEGRGGSYGGGRGNGNEERELQALSGLRRRERSGAGVVIPAVSYEGVSQPATTTGRPSGLSR